MYTYIYGNVDIYLDNTLLCFFGMPLYIFGGGDDLRKWLTVNGVPFQPKIEYQPHIEEQSTLTMAADVPLKYTYKYI